MTCLICDEEGCTAPHECEFNWAPAMTLHPAESISEVVAAYEAQQVALEQRRESRQKKRGKVLSFTGGRS